MPYGAVIRISRSFRWLEYVIGQIFALQRRFSGILHVQYFVFFLFEVLYQCSVISARKQLSKKILLPLSSFIWAFPRYPPDHTLSVYKEVFKIVLSTAAGR